MSSYPWPANWASQLSCSVTPKTICYLPPLGAAWHGFLRLALFHRASPEHDFTCGLVPLEHLGDSPSHRCHTLALYGAPGAGFPRHSPAREGFAVTVRFSFAHHYAKRHKAYRYGTLRVTNV